MSFNPDQTANLARQGDRGNRASAPGGDGGLQKNATSQGPQRTRKDNPVHLTLTTAA